MTPTKPTLREMSDFLAERLLRWDKFPTDERFRGDWSDTLNKEIVHAWQPHENAGQAMRVFEEFRSRTQQRIRITGEEFYDSSVCAVEIFDVLGDAVVVKAVRRTDGPHRAAPDLPSAIVEASYLAIVQERD